MPPVDDTTRGALRDAPGPTEGGSLPPGDGGDGLGPLLGSLPPDVLREWGCPWDEDTCYEAARGGHLECLRYAHEHGCPWDEYTCSEAARGGHLECLKYAYEHGCPWDERTFDEAEYPFLRAPATEVHALSVPHHAHTPQMRDAMAVHSTLASKTSKTRLERWMMDFVMDDDHYNHAA